MADRPILFNAPMVRALIDGRKTQTRRVLGLRGRYNIFKPGEWSDSCVLDPGNAEWRASDTPYTAGDRLWVRETFWQTSRYPFTMPSGESSPQSMNWGHRIQYAADGSPESLPNQHYPNGLRGDAISAPNPDAVWLKRPSIHMPRWASRLTLIVTDVRVQRLQDVTRGDCMDEGCPFPNMADGPNPRDWFREYWDSIYGPGAWDANPWVAALTFRVHQQNIDQMESTYD